MKSHAVLAVRVKRPSFHVGKSVGDEENRRQPCGPQQLRILDGHIAAGEGQLPVAQEQAIQRCRGDHEAEDRMHHGDAESKEGDVQRQQRQQRHDHQRDDGRTFDAGEITAFVAGHAMRIVQFDANSGGTVTA